MNIPVPSLVTFLVYLLGMLAIGVIAWRMTSNLSDYILGGRRLGSAVTALSAGASDMSGWLLLGLPGAIYLAGFAEAAIGIGLVAGAYFNWKVIAPRMRVFTEVYGDSLTLPDYLDHRFTTGGRLLRGVSALVILVFFTFYTSAGLVGGATLFKNVFGMDYTAALWIGGLVIVSYTFIGGFLAVSWTDFIQGILMFLALVIVPVVVVTELGGWQETTRVIGGVDPGLLDPWAGFSLIGFVSLMAWGLGYMGQPHILARFMAIRSVGAVKHARWIGMGWMVLALAGSIFTGLAGVAWFELHPDRTGDLADNAEVVFILLTQVLFNPWVAGFLLAAILAAVMSTVDSQLLVCSSAVSEDLYLGWLRPNASQGELVWVSRIAVVVIALIALGIAMDPGARVLELVGYAWAGLGSAFGPVIAMSLLSRRMSGQAAIAGMLTGALTVLGWGLASQVWPDGLYGALYEMIPGFGLSLLVILAMTRLWPAENDEQTERFDQACQKLAEV